MLYITAYQVGVIDWELRFGTLPCWISWSDGTLMWLLYSKVCIPTMSPGSVSRLFPRVLGLMTYNIYNMSILCIHNHTYPVSNVGRCYFLQSRAILGSFSKVALAKEHPAQPQLLMQQKQLNRSNALIRASQGDSPSRPSHGTAQGQNRDILLTAFIWDVSWVGPTDAHVLQ